MLPILCVLPQILLNTEQPVVFGDTLRAAGGSRLDLARVERDRQIGNRRVLRLAGAMGNDCSITCSVCHFNGIHRLGQGADLIEFNQN